MAPSAVTTVSKSHFRLARNCLKGTVGDAINLILATAAYNCEKWMRASAPMLLFIGGAIISIGYMTPPLSVYGTRYANHCAPPQTALLAGDSSCRSVPHIMRSLHNMGRTKISGYFLRHFGEKFCDNFSDKIKHKEQLILKNYGISMLNSYKNIIEWRNHFAHTASFTANATLKEVCDSYCVGKNIILCLDTALS